MAQENTSHEEKQENYRSGNAVLLAAETLRRSSHGPHTREARASKTEEKISVFWRVFGGTILSIVALVALTAFNNFSGSLSELRKDLNSQIETRGDMIKKDEFNSRLTSIWNNLKEVQAAGGAVAALTERSKALEGQLKAGEEDRKELRRQLEDQRRAAEDQCKEWSRKLEEQRKGAEEERKEYARKLEEQRKGVEDERKELQRDLQKLAERLASVEGRQGLKAAATTIQGAN